MTRNVEQFYELGNLRLHNYSFINTQPYALRVYVCSMCTELLDNSIDHTKYVFELNLLTVHSDSYYLYYIRHILFAIPKTELVIWKAYIHCFYQWF